MKLTYIANIRMPTEKAHGIQITKMCGAFASKGLEVELLIPWRFNAIKENAFNYYKIKKNFKIRKLPSFDLVGLPFGFWIQSVSFALVVFLYLAFKKTDIIYSRDLSLYFLLSRVKKNLIYEAHYFPGHIRFYQGILKKIDKLIVITKELKRLYQSTGIDSKDILVASDGVDFDFFQIEENQKECRQKLRLPQDKKIILYTGHLYQWKGAQILADASQYLGDDCLVVFVGGTKDDEKKFKEKNQKLRNILIIGHRLYAEIPYWLRSADILVLPNSAKKKISQYYTSPLKLFEYMSAQKPIIASDLLSIRDVLNESNAVLIKPDEPLLLAKSIKKALANYDLSVRISKQAFDEAQRHTWGNRAEKIICFMRGCQDY